MGTPDNKLSELVDIFKSWMPRRTEPTNVSRDFWMPDHSCRVCYDCDSQFTIFNRRHHCRLCGRVFCARCTANSVPAPSGEPRIGREDGERIRVCNFCFKQWEQGIAAVDNGAPAASPGLSPSPSATSLVSTKSSCTYHSSSSTVGSTPYSTGPYQRVPYSSGLSPRQSCQGDSVTLQQDNVTSQRNIGSDAAMAESSPNQFGFCMDRSDDEDDDYGVYHSDSESRHFSHANDYYGAINNEEFDSVYEPQKVHSDGENTDAKSLSSLSPENFDTQGVVGKKLGEESDDHDNRDECEASPYDMETTNAEPVDFENNGLLWLPPEPEDEEDEREADLFDDDDDGGGGGDGGGGATGEWGYLHSSNSFGGGEFRTREKSIEEHRKAMKNVVEGHFRALVSQLLQVENLPLIDEDDKETWLDIITSLSWEAATLLKPDTSKGGGMDPGGYVKIKCIACGSRSESMVVKGVVCKKNMAHRRMPSKIEKPRFLILGGALEYQRVSNLLSSFDTLLQQEMDHLKMAVAKIDAHHPNVLLVEKSVSRYAQDYLLAKDISLVLNIKRPLLEQISRCTGAQIVPSIDHLTSPKLGYCDMFHVEKFFEVHGSAGQGGKKLTKTLMFFEGCPKPLGVTILLKGTNGDELKKVKHVVQYGVFAAYHLALETSFLADEGASLPELPLKSVITVLPDKPSSIDRSISTIPGFSVPAAGKPQGSVASSELQKSNKGFISDSGSCTKVASILKNEGTDFLCLSKTLCSPPSLIKHLSPIESTSPFTSLSPPGQDTIDSYHKELSSICASEDIKDNKNVSSKESCEAKTAKAGEALVHDGLISNSFSTADAFGHGGGINHADGVALASNLRETPQHLSIKYHTDNQNEEVGSSKEEFPPSPSDHQSILVSLSTRCVWKGTVCERAHLFRIKYYGSFDKPLGRFLRDHLFDHGYLCRSCGMPSEAHVHCYTHRQGSLTISVKKLPEIFLPGEKEGKIWMWHRCLRCPRTSGFPPATRRVVMSDAAWGLSFGKFLELSFSNHAAANRVASCGHSLHRDCLRFYGFGRMVACFRYASIHIHSVYLPPPKLEFYYDNQEWIQKEAYEVGNRAKLLFTELRNALHQILEKTQDGGKKAPESTHQIAELKEMLQKEREDFEESLRKVINGEVKSGQPAIDILEINKLRRQLLFHSYIWVQRLIHAASLSNKNFQEGVTSTIAKLKEKPIVTEKLVEIPGKGLSSCTALQETKPGINLKQGRDAGCISQTGGVQDRTEMGLDTDHGNEASANVIDKSDSLESGKIIGMALSEGNECSAVESLSDTLDAAWTGKTHPTSTTPKENGYSLPDSTLVKSSTVVKIDAPNSDVENGTVDHGGVQATRSVNSTIPLKGIDNAESCTIGARMPFLTVTSSFSKSISFNTQKLCIGEHNPVYVALFRELERQTGARLLLPIGVNDTVIPVFDDEPTSVIAYTLVSPNYHLQISESERSKDALDSAVSLPLFDSANLLSLNSFDEAVSETYRSLGSSDESILSMSHSRSSESLLSKDIHARVSFTDEGPLGKVKYTVTSYYATQFEALRKTCCPSELDFVRSLSRCKKWGAQGGKSNVFFAKTLDDRFIIKQVTKTELESFIKFAPAYFKYLSESISTRSPTCLAKILGIYQVSSKHGKAGKETKMDVLVMENLLFRRNITRLYDLKGSSRSRYNPDTSGSNKVLLDQNLIEAMPTSPIFVGNKAKRLLERAVWNDTAFLASIDVMDYSLLVGVDEEKHELVLGIIDFMRQYTWDKHLETWVKASGILGGPKNTSPTVISPQQYKKRFRKAMTTYFLMVPDQWSPQITVPESQSDHFEETSQAQSDL